MGWILFLIAAVAVVVLHFWKESEAESIREAARKERLDLLEKHELVRLEMREKILALSVEIKSLEPFKGIRDVSLEAARIKEEAEDALKVAEGQANVVRHMAETQAAELRRKAEAEAAELRSNSRAANADAKAKAEALVASANARAARLLEDAEARAAEIAGDAYRALREAERLEQAATAMKNVIDGYGDKYLRPTYSLLDQLAEEYGFDEAGKDLKEARARSQSMVESGRAAACSYVEQKRRDTAIRFVLDAFNGKVDSIFSRIKASSNIGTFEQQVKDAYSLVNLNGEAFRSARITQEYLDARLDELRLAFTVVALKERDREEQRRLREIIREEERAQREINRALREAAKEEEALQRAMSKIQSQVERASEEQRAEFEAKLQELQIKLLEAEARNQRAISMAQQTKAGHVYVISNIGSFGDKVYKVGMTRRLEPYDRLRELGDASVPFPFDVHAMIWSEDAPSLEHALHKRFITAQVNKVNPRKEFFRLSVEELKAEIEALGVHASWTLVAEASQYRESLAIEEDLREQNSDAVEWVRCQMAVTAEELSVEEAVEDLTCVRNL